MSATILSRKNAEGPQVTSSFGAFGRRQAAKVCASTNSFSVRTHRKINGAVGQSITARIRSDKVNASVPREMAVQNSVQSVEGLDEQHASPIHTVQTGTSSADVGACQLRSSSHTAGLCPRSLGDYRNQIDQGARVTAIDPWTS